MPITVGQDTSKTRKTLEVNGKSFAYYSIPAAEAAGLGEFGKLPAALKVVLENMLRFEDGKTVTKDDIVAFAPWLNNKGKDDHEIAALRRACTITVEAFEAALGWIAPGLTEREIARRLLDDMTVRGAEASAFAPIVAAGPNGAVPHPSPSDRPVGRGELLTMDFGARVDGYHADMTRTVAVGAVGSDLTDLYDLVRRAQQAGVEAVRDGIEAKALDAVCRGVIAEAGHGADFRHGTGHGVGLMIHEEPFLGIQSTGTLRDRMAITVEPGVYVPGLGGVRIEDVVLVGHTDGERLTTASHDLIVL